MASKPYWMMISAVWAVSCSPPAPTQPSALLRTLDDLAGFGNKRVGTLPDVQAGEYVADRLRAAGLTEVSTSSFQFPRYDLDASSLNVMTDGQTGAPIPFEVFEGSGVGEVSGTAVAVNIAEEADLTGIDLSGKVAVVNRSQTVHRSTQYLNVTNKGAVAMLYVSATPENLPQVGSVRRTFESMGTIPAVTVGADDGAMLESALATGHKVEVALSVEAHTSPAMGGNVVGKIAGSDPSGEIVIGAHYDSWFAGSTDNGSGVAAMLALAERRAKEGRPRYTLLFVAYDGEEVALYGGYHFLREHQVLNHDPILAVLNFEIPAAKNADLYGLARSNLPLLDRSLLHAQLDDIYSLYVPMDAVPMLFGGVIPTDIQGLYRYGVPTASTAVDAPYYHTIKDTPDQVDTGVLAKVVDQFDLALDALLDDPASGFAPRDTALWSAELQIAPRKSGDPLAVEVVVKNGAGVLQTGASVTISLLVDDFFLTAEESATTDGQGHATFSFTAAQAMSGSGRRFVHVTSGPKYPLVEQVLAVE